MEKRRKHQRLFPAAGCRLPASGFTLIELLIVIAIIIILAAIGVGVGYKFAAAADIEQTRANMAIIMNAIEMYFDEVGQYPENIDTEPGTDEVWELRIRRENTGNVLPLYTRFVGKLNEIDKDCIRREEDEGDNDYDIFHFTTPDGEVIQYIRDGGMGGTPLLIAPGEDGLYATDAENNDDREAWGKDDIRSDK